MNFDHLTKETLMAQREYIQALHELNERLDHVTGITDPTIDIFHLLLRVEDFDQEWNGIDPLPR